MARRSATKAAAAEEFVAELADDHLVCRLAHHAYEFEGLVEGEIAKTVVVLLRCSRCGVCREQHLDVIGLEVVRNKYSEYPEGYRAVGLGRVNGPAIRGEVLDRYLVERRNGR